jgi:hypothetical protein
MRGLAAKVSGDLVVWYACFPCGVQQELNRILIVLRCDPFELLPGSPKTGPPIEVGQQPKISFHANRSSAQLPNPPRTNQTRHRTHPQCASAANPQLSGSLKLTAL